MASKKSIFQDWPFAGVSGFAALLVFLVNPVCLWRRASMHPMRDRTPHFASGADYYLFDTYAHRKIQRRWQQAAA